MLTAPRWCRWSAPPGRQLLLRVPVHLDAHGFDLPDVLAIFADGPIRRELAHARGVQDRHARPLRGILVRGGHPALAVDVGLEIGQQHEVVAFEETFHQSFEQRAIPA